MPQESNVTVVDGQLSYDDKRKLAGRLLADLTRGNGSRELALHADNGTFLGYFVPAARYYLLKEDTALIENLKHRAVSPGPSVPWQEFKKTLEGLGS